MGDKLLKFKSARHSQPKKNVNEIVPFNVFAMRLKGQRLGVENHYAPNHNLGAVLHATVELGEVIEQPETDKNS